MIEQAVVLTAGHGRGNPAGRPPFALTRDRPKAMLPVLGKPVVARVMDRAREAGIGRFVIVMGEQDGAVAAYLSKSWYPDCKVRFVIQSAPALGTVDALRLAAPHIDGPFLLIACDVLAPADHLPALLKSFDTFSGDLMLTVVRAMPQEITHGAMVEVDGDRVVRHVTRPPAEELTGDLTSVMIHACGSRVLQYLEQVPYSDRSEEDFAYVITRLIEAGAHVGYWLAPWYMRLADVQDLLRVNLRFLEEGRDAHILSELPDSITIRPPVRIDPRVGVGQGAVVGPNVYLESGCTVGQGAQVADSVVLNGSVIPAGAVIRGQLVTPA
jgi:mannose-1-phosphate guanylyltransferase